MSFCCRRHARAEAPKRRQGVADLLTLGSWRLKIEKALSRRGLGELQILGIDVARPIVVTHVLHCDNARLDEDRGRLSKSTPRRPPGPTGVLLTPSTEDRTDAATWLDEEQRAAQISAVRTTAVVRHQSFHI